MEPVHAPGGPCSQPDGRLERVRVSVRFGQEEASSGCLLAVGDVPSARKDLRLLRNNHPSSFGVSDVPEARTPWAVSCSGHLGKAGLQVTPSREDEVHRGRVESAGERSGQSREGDPHLLPGSVSQGETRLLCHQKPLRHLRSVCSGRRAERWTLSLSSVTVMSVMQGTGGSTER